MDATFAEYLHPQEPCPDCYHKGWAHPQQQPGGAVDPVVCIGQHCSCTRRQAPARPQRGAGS